MLICDEVNMHTLYHIKSEIAGAPRGARPLVRRPPAVLAAEPVENFILVYSRNARNRIVRHLCNFLIGMGLLFDITPHL